MKYDNFEISVKDQQEKSLADLCEYQGAEEGEDIFTEDNQGVGRSIEIDFPFKYDAQRTERIIKGLFDLTNQNFTEEVMHNQLVVHRTWRLAVKQMDELGPDPA